MLAQWPAAIELRHGESIRLHAIDAGVHYRITEAQTPDYQAALANADGTIQRAQTAQVSAVNTSIQTAGQPTATPMPDLPQTGETRHWLWLFGLGLAAIGLGLWRTRRRLRTHG